MVEEARQYCHRGAHMALLRDFSVKDRGREGKWCLPCKRRYDDQRRSGLTPPPSRGTITRKCGYCEAPLIGRAPRARYCNDDHARWARQLRNPTYQLDQNRRLLYGLEPEEFERIYAAQGRVCAICRKAPRRPCVDHDHDTGAVRGILCTNCNSGIAMLGEDPALLRAAIDYLTGSE